MPRHTPNKIKAEPGTQAEGSYSAARRQSSRHSLPSVKVMEENDIYVVEKIIAKSLRKGLGPDGRYEHQYLVRWAGYAPRDDTWEMCSNVQQGSYELVKAFEASEQPITIVKKDNKRGKYGETRYLVEICGGRRGKEKNWSPLAEQEWMTASEIKAKIRISQGAIKAAIREWEVSQLPTPRATPITASSSSSTPTKAEERAYSRGPTYTERVLIEILDDQRYRKYSMRNQIWRTRYLVRHKLQNKFRGYQEKQEWYSNHWLLKVFGSGAMTEKLAAYMPEPKFELETEGVAVKQEVLEDGTIISVRNDVITDYEQERLRRIKENEDLIKQLGLGV